MVRPSTALSFIGATPRRKGGLVKRLSSRTIVSVAAIVPLIGLAACQPGAPREGEPTTSAASALTSADTCPGTRWIGALDQSGACPTPLSNAWSVQPLFAGAGATIPPGLDRYCVYELTHAGLPSAADLGNLPGSGVKTTRSYSLVGATNDRRRYEIAVLHVRGGQGGSAWMHEAVQVGDLLEIDGPGNAFPLAPQAERSVGARRTTPAGMAAANSQ